MMTIMMMAIGGVSADGGSDNEHDDVDYLMIMIVMTMMVILISKIVVIF
jgi:hypothetical protein